MPPIHTFLHSTILGIQLTIGVGHMQKICVCFYVCMYFSYIQKLLLYSLGKNI